MNEPSKGDAVSSVTMQDEHVRFKSFVGLPPPSSFTFIPCICVCSEKTKPENSFVILFKMINVSDFSLVLCIMLVCQCLSASVDKFCIYCIY